MGKLRKITREELDMILKNHELWFATDGKEGERADLSYTDLRGFNLTKVNLAFADLSGTNLSRVNLSCADLHCSDLEGAWLLRADLYRATLKYANLTGANLSGTNLIGADLDGADLSGANLFCANLFHADLSAANLSGSDLRFANLERADLCSAGLRHANLSYANLSDANLRDANLQNAALTDAKNFPNIPMACPSEGSFIGWKTASNYIIKLEIPADAKRSSGAGIKCRCNKAKVLAIENEDGTPADVTEVHSDYDPEFIYRIGETVIVDNFDDNRFNECAPGIHFYMDRVNVLKTWISVKVNKQGGARNGKEGAWENHT